MSGIDYKASGVDIAGGDAWVNVIKRLVARRGGALPRGGAIGGFSGLYPIGGGRSLAACCDGVGTKVEIAKAAGIYRGLGVDLVAMSVNDLVTCGAKPLFFLDYIACGKLEPAILEEIVEGVLDACCESDCALLGGETAEMPGVYPPDGFDLAGFAVGLVDDDKVTDGGGIRPGDVIVGLPSSGAHSNGFSLVRRVLGNKIGNDGELARLLTCPTKLYVRAALTAAGAVEVKGMAHITGGGLEANTDRAVPDGLRSAIDFSSWERPEIFGRIARAGVEEQEMRRVFNLGIGYVFIVAEDSVAEASRVLTGLGESPVVIGRVERRP